MNLRRRLSSVSCLAAAWVTCALFASGCDGEFDLPDREAQIEAAGDISPPVENCEFEAIVAPGAGGDAGADAGDVGDTGDAGDAGTNQDAGDAGTNQDAGDAGTNQDAGDTGDAADAGDAADTGQQQDGQFRARIERVGDAVSIPYIIRDREGDDQRIRVEICTVDDGEADECGTAVRAAGDDRTYFVPTTPAGACILHVFYWDVGCGRFVGGADDTPERRTIDDVDQQLVARVSVVGSDESPVETEPFALSDEQLGFDAVPACD